jgi:hypothetical protein
LGQVEGLYVYVLGLSRILGIVVFTTWSERFFTPFRIQSGSAKYSLRVYGTMRAHFRWGILKTAEVGVIKSYTVVGYGELDRAE